MEYSRLKEILGRFKNHKLVVIGDVVLDHYVHGDVERLNPEAPVPILRVRRERVETGGAGNIAKYSANLGVGATLISVIGDDRDGETVERSANQEGYRTRLVRDPSRPTIRKTRHIVENKTAGQQLLRVDHEETHNISGEVEEKLIQEVKDAVASGIDGIVISDYAKGVVTKRVAEAILDLAGKNDILVAADVKPSRARYFVGASIISPNLIEAHEFIGLNPHEETVHFAELAKLVYMKLCSDVYLTMGANGIYVYCGGEKGVHLKQSVTAIEPSCAGDMAITSLLLALVSGATEVEAAEIANAACGVIVQQVGAGKIDYDGIEGAFRAGVDLSPAIRREEILDKTKKENSEFGS